MGGKPRSTTSSPLLQARCGSTSPGGQTQSPRVCWCRHVPRSTPTPNRPPTERGTWTKCGPSRGRLSSASCRAGGVSILAKAWRAEPTTVTSQSRSGWAGGLTRKGQERTSGEGRVRVLIRAVVTQAYTFVETQTTLECVYFIVYTF